MIRPFCSCPVRIVDRELLRILLDIVRRLALQVGDTGKLCWKIIVNHRENRRLAAALPEVKFPPYELSNAVFNHCSYRVYYESGLAHARYLMETVRRFRTAADLVVCEWGCGPARLIQHLRGLDAGVGTLIGTDCDPEAIAWCRQALPEITFVGNQLDPPFPLADSSVDVLYCCAVFSHLSERLHGAWIEEILRVLKPGGLFIGSFNGDNYRHLLDPAEREQYGAGALVVRPGGAEGSRQYAAFQSDRYVRQTVLAGFADVMRLDDAPFVQTLWCATAPG